jgi:hypothetical protein
MGYGYSRAARRTVHDGCTGRFLRLPSPSRQCPKWVLQRPEMYGPEPYLAGQIRVKPAVYGPTAHVMNIFLMALKRAEPRSLAACFSFPPYLLSLFRALHLLASPLLSLSLS